MSNETQTERDSIYEGLLDSAINRSRNLIVSLILGAVAACYLAAPNPTKIGYSKRELEEKVTLNSDLAQRCLDVAAGEDKFFSHKDQQNLAKSLGYQEDLSDYETIDLGLATEHGALLGIHSNLSVRTIMEVSPEKMQEYLESKR